MINMVSYKNQLQEYLQKASQPLPIYETIKEGPSHMPKFKSTIIVNEVRYDCPLEYHTARAAEHAVAQIALEQLVKKANTGGTLPNALESRLSKTILQEYTQKMNLELPTYSFKKTGLLHSPTFCATVEVDGVSYSGGVATSRKEAESRAARTALLAIQAHACNASAQMAFASASGFQHDVHSGMKRDRNLEDPSEEYKDNNCEGQTAAMDSEDPSLKVASSGLAQERGKQPQVKSCVVQQGQMKEEGNGAYQDEEQECEEVQEEQQGGQEVALSRTVNMTDGREDEGKGQTRHPRRKNRRNKKAHKGGHQ